MSYPVYVHCTVQPIIELVSMLINKTKNNRFLTHTIKKGLLLKGQSHEIGVAQLCKNVLRHFVNIQLRTELQFENLFLLL